MKQPIWQSFGVSAQGPGHVRLGLPNQDAWLSRHTSWGDVLAVCDGMGSYIRADWGARAGCHAVIEAAELWAKKPQASTEAFLHLIQRLWLFLIEPHKPEECYCTCLFAARLRGYFLVAQLGDGMSCVISKDKNFLPFEIPEKDFSNATYGLSQQFDASLWKTALLPEESINGLILATDGVADDLRIESMPQFAADIITMAREEGINASENELEELLKDWPVAGHSDDKTIACLFRED